MKRSLRVLLDHLIDYAGLFPPASLSMEDAVRNYARYRDGEHAFALGKFIVPQARAHEVPPDFPLSILGIDEVKDIADAKPGAFVESFDLDDIQRRGLRAKIRTGGVTPDAFPSIDEVARFIRACKEKGLAFKATAGLHHPVRCESPLGMMHGFLNVFLAAVFVDDAEEILRETDAQRFVFTDDGVRWRDRFASTDDLALMRRDFAISFGSCSFEEPIADLEELGFL